MQTDTSGEVIPASLFHGTQDALPSATAPSNQLHWWRVMPHAEWLAGGPDPDSDDYDSDFALEMDHLLRTSYGNIVFQALSTSDDPEHRSLAARGFDFLGGECSMMFVTGNPSYACRYGQVLEIDADADGVIALIPDPNASVESWIVLMRRGMPFPLKASCEPVPDTSPRP